MIKQLSLTNFRQFKNLTLNFESKTVIIHGNNTRGKSSILEALFIFYNGYSPFTSLRENLINNKQDLSEKNPSEYFRIDCNLEVDGEASKESVYCDMSGWRYLIDGKKTTPKKFLQTKAATIFSPELIEILMISPDKRRAFLDRIITRLDIEYDSQIKAFSKILKQRNARLKKLAKVFYETGEIAYSDPQILIWTKEFNSISREIIKKREEISSRLMRDGIRIEYKPSINHNEVETSQDEQNLRKDIATGHTTRGPHRDDWELHTTKDIKRFGSRGEKRIAIGKLIFQTQEIAAEDKGLYPTLLLDDIPSELDSDNTLKILSDEVLHKQQTFITTINIEEIPEKIKTESQIIDLNSLL